MAEAIRIALALGLTPIALIVGAIGIYLGVLSAAGLLAVPRRPRAAAGRSRFAILVPAHNEAAVIGRLLTSLRELRYPAQRVDIFVVADNCTDATASIARRGGAVVFERTDATQRAKGHALRWLIERVRTHGQYDAYVVLDADSVVSPWFLTAMDSRLAAGADVVQAHYRVLNATESPLSAIREAAFASLHYLRPAGREAMRLSVGLKGNGMCFRTTALDRVGWSSAGLAEDVELHITLVRAGFRVEFAPEAVVRAEMPTTFADAESQNVRWEAGRLAVARSEVLSLIRDGITSRRFILIDAGMEQLIPPLSVVVVAGSACALLALIAGMPWVAAVGATGTGLVIAHFAVGLVAIGAPRSTYLALLVAPRYVLWKILLWIRAVATPRGIPWVRTARIRR